MSTADRIKRKLRHVRAQQRRRTALARHRVARLIDSPVPPPRPTERLYREPQLQSVDELLGIMRHDSHRIEKSVYNNIHVSKRDAYLQKWEFLASIYETLEERGVDASDPTLDWSRKIHDAFDELEEAFIRPHSSEPAPIDVGQAEAFVDFVSQRRSVRVWAADQPPKHDLHAMALAMIDAARWAPTSGNRQPWRFSVIIDQEEKDLLRGIKEDHCVHAPALVFLGVDRRVYGALGEHETGMFIDAGAAAQQMVLLAHRCGFGTCWNHFAHDLIESRPVNVERYTEFAKHLGIADYVEPIAIMAFGVPEFIPPVPARTLVPDLLLTRPELLQVRPELADVAEDPPS